VNRVLAIHRYYWPDTPPYASILRAIAERWAAAGHRVDILTSQPSYKPEVIAHAPKVEQVHGVTVRRLPMKPDRSSRWRRVFNVGWFPVAVASRVLVGRRYDVVMCSTVPPVLLGWAVSLAARLRRARFVYHCMDLHPEIGRLSGEFSSGPVYKLLSRMELSACRRAAAIVVLSEDMERAVLDRDPALADRIVVLTNFELPDYEGEGDPDLASPVPARPDRLRVVFTGNLGRFQGLDTIVQAVLGAGPELADVELVLMGEGAARPELERLLAEAGPAGAGRVTLVPHGSPRAVRALLRTAHMGLVSLSPEVIRFAYPSKTATYLGAGLPLLVAVEPDSFLARTVLEHRVGGLLPVDDVAGARAALAEWSARRDELPAMAERASAYWREEYAAEQILPRWEALLEDVA
jgi:glycosyltransferase involved in cell wall biosynthesis